MATKKTEPGRPAAQPPDEDIDLSDIPEVTDFSKAERGKYYEQATGKPLPRAVVLLNKAEAEVRRLREENRALYGALRRLTDGMHTGDHEDAPAALAAASALVGSLAPGYEDDES